MQKVRGSLFGNRVAVRRMIGFGRTHQMMVKVFIDKRKRFCSLFTQLILSYLGE